MGKITKKYQAEMLRRIYSIGLIAFALTPIAQYPASINDNGPYQAHVPGFDRGMQSTMYCGNKPESWVRGSAVLDTNSGEIRITIQVETDSTAAGPKGVVEVKIRDAQGKNLATAGTEEFGHGGKPPGKAVIRNYSGHANVSSEVAQKADSLYVEAKCTGSINQLFGISLADVENAIKILVTVGSL